jgi:branched-chain amino acid transport system substrate-binding protein
MVSKVMIKNFLYLFLPLFVFATQATAQIRLGSTLTLTGPTATYGENSRDGMELAKDEVNVKGGIKGENLEIFYEDFGETDLKRAVSAAQKLVSVDKVSAILPMITEDAEVVYPIASKRNVTTMAIYAGGKDLTKGKTLFYQVSSADEALVKRLADYLLSKGFQSACILSEQGAYALPLAHFVKNYLSGKLKSSPSFADYAPQMTDFRSILMKLHASGCASLILVTPPNRQGIILKQLGESRWNPLKLGLDTSEDSSVLATAGDSTNDVVYVKYSIGSKDFRDKFKSRFGREPGVPAALAYDAVKVLASAMEQVGTNGASVAEYLDALSNFQGASGEIRFEDGTRSERPVELWTIKTGKPQPLVN